MLPDTPWPKGEPAPWNPPSPERPTLRGLDAATLSQLDHDRGDFALPWAPSSKRAGSPLASPVQEKSDLPRQHINGALASKGGSSPCSRGGACAWVRSRFAPLTSAAPHDRWEVSALGNVADSRRWRSSRK